MQLKAYQQKALEQLERWIDALKEAVKEREDAKTFYGKRKKAIPQDLKNYPRSAWNSLKEQGFLPVTTQGEDTSIPDYISRTAASGEPIPHVCMKIPTGGGKTLLGVAALECIKAERGFVLWIVPTAAIYEQTINAFRNREHPYRVMLERISGGRVKLLEKSTPFAKQDVENYLCIMMLMLPSANRQKGRAFLKIFRDSGAYTSFFPQQDDAAANQKLVQQCSDLERIEGVDCVKQSLINVLKLIRPTVILDEAHKAYGKNDANNKDFVKSVNRLNPRFVLELSATPKLGISNILINIGGVELKNEEMIKLPIEIRNFSNSDWQRTLDYAQEKLQQLEGEAQKLKARENRYVRPIALVRVTRTGSEQRQQGHIHAEDARDYLMRKLKVPAQQIKIQSSQQKELAGEDLLNEMSAVRWIITKDALKEGWDCSFAYILALLDNTKANTAITQMVGRVMRQPQACTIDGIDALNRCYIYCYDRDVGVAVEAVKNGLEQEGLSGLDNAVIDDQSAAGAEVKKIKRRKPYRKLKIFLPQVLHKHGKKWRPLDYDRDILGAMDWAAIKAGGAVQLDDRDAIAEITVAVDIHGESAVSKAGVETDERVTVDYFVRRLIDIVPNPWQAARIAAAFIKRHKPRDDVRLLKNRIYLAGVLRARIKQKIDREAEAVFRQKIRQDTIRFRLVTDQKLNYAFQNTLEVSIGRDEGTIAQHGHPVQRSLFEVAPASSFNNLEKGFALYLEASDAIFWWHKIAARQEYALQGWRRDRVYPDFIACRQGDSKLMIFETKGLHLKGNEDTAYKEKLLQTLDKTYRNALPRGEMQVKEPSATFRILLEDTWREKITHILKAS